MAEGMVQEKEGIASRTSTSGKQQPAVSYHQSSSSVSNHSMFQQDNSAASIAWSDNNGSERTLQSPQRTQGSPAKSKKKKYSPRTDGLQQFQSAGQGDENGDIEMCDRSTTEENSPTSSKNNATTGKQLNSPQKKSPRSSPKSPGKDVGGPSGNDASFSSNPVEGRSTQKKKKKSKAVAPVPEGASEGSPRQSPNGQEASSERTVNTNGSESSINNNEATNGAPASSPQPVRRYEVIDEGGRGHYFAEDDIRQMQLIVDDSTGRSFLYHDDFGYLAVRDTNLTVVEYVEEPPIERSTKISWSDQHGYPLVEVFYSDNLHYSDPLSFDPVAPRTEGCCSIM